MILTDTGEIKDYMEFEKKQEALKEKAFSDLAFIFDDLWW